MASTYTLLGSSDTSSDALVLHITTVLGILVFKLTVLVVGYLFARLGYNLLIKGVGGEFKLRTELKGMKADLVSASPGLFFIAMATVMIGVAIWKDKPFSIQLQRGSSSEFVNDESSDQTLEKPPTIPQPGKSPGKDTTNANPSQ